MDDRAIARVIEILETDDDLVVPLKELWQSSRPSFWRMMLWKINYSIFWPPDKS
jgi:hypothetical protein